MRLLEIFETFGEPWPADLISTHYPTEPSDFVMLRAQFDEAIDVCKIVTDVGPGGELILMGELKLREAAAPARTELISRLFPSLKFVFDGDNSWTSDFRVILGGPDRYAVQIDTLPLEVMLPVDLLGAHPDPEKQETDKTIKLNGYAAHSTIHREFSLRFNCHGDVDLRPHAPISIGPCKIFGLPALGVHDFSFIGSPINADRRFDWIQRPLSADRFMFESGGLGFGGIELDFVSDDSMLKDLRSKLQISDGAELVLEDIVLPGFFFPPFPQYGTLGLRRTLSPGENLAAHLGFEDAPLSIKLGDTATLFFSELFYATPPAPDDLISGLSLEAGVAVDFGDDNDDNWEFELGLIEGDLLRTSVRRPYLDVVTGEPVETENGGEETPPPELEDLWPILDIDLWKVVVSINRLRVGFSINELTKDKPEASDALYAVGDILIAEKPEAKQGESSVEVKSEDGQPYKLALIDVGWDRGKPSGDLKKAKNATLKLGPFALELHDMGLVAEQGATYLSLSGGIRQEVSPFSGRIWFERLRGRLAGNPDAPSFKLGGLGAALKKENVVEISVHGSFRNDLLADGTRIKENGLGGSIILHVGSVEWGLGIDAYWGERIPPAGDAVDYFLFQCIFYGTLPAGPVEFRRIRALFADDLAPKLTETDRNAGELKYYSWMKTAAPTTLTDSRGLAPWKPEDKAWAFGAGLGISFVGCGDIISLEAFGLGFDSKSSDGLVVTLELKLFDSDKPIALGIFEYDFTEDSWVVQIEIDLNLKDIVSGYNGPFIEVGGKITVANKPCTFAVGRIDDQESWLTAKLEWRWFSIFEIKLIVAICGEWVDDRHAGGGALLSANGKGDLKVIKIELHGSLLLILKWLTSGSNDFAGRLVIELGLALTLFGFIRLGLAVSVLGEILCHRDSYKAIRLTFRVETPWFLPDVTVTCEWASGSIEPATRSMLTSPLLSADGRAGARSLSMSVQRADGGDIGQAPELISLAELTSTADVWSDPSDVRPLPLNSEIMIQFSHIMGDRLGIAELEPDVELQTTGDEELEMNARYEVIGLQIRRRPIGETDWETVETISNSSDQRAFRWDWELDSRSGGIHAPKTLILNGKAPFSVGFNNAEGDADILRENPDYPCCTLRPPDVARFDLCNKPFGPLDENVSNYLAFIGRGTPAPIRIALQGCIVHAPEIPGSSCDRVGAIALDLDALVLLAGQENLASAVFSIATRGSPMVIAAIARNRSGQIVQSSNFPSDSVSAFQTIEVNPGSPFRTVELRVIRRPTGQDVENAVDDSTLEFDWIECVTQRDQDRYEADQARCDRIDEHGHVARAPFLAQHEYEIEITTRVSVNHTVVDWEEKDIVERVGFRTAGPPGLNETSEPGLELEPYIINREAGGRGLLYGEESVFLVLDSGLTLFGPGPAGASEGNYRLPVVLTVEPAVVDNPKVKSDWSSYENEEWFEMRKGETNFFVSVLNISLISALTTDPRRLRLRQLVETANGGCPVDDVWNERRPRLGVSPFDADGRPFWKPRTTYHAAMRLSGGPVVDRNPFVASDISRFVDASGIWEIENNALYAKDHASGGFGDDDWDYYRAKLIAECPTDSEVALAVLVSGTHIDGGVKFAYSINNAGVGKIAVTTLTDGRVLAERQIDEPPQTINLQVDVFADRLRCRCAGETLSVDREARPSGRSEIFARNTHVQRLQVRSLEMTGFEFTTSRYRSFTDHINSAGDIDLMRLGDEAENIETVAMTFGGAVVNAMRPQQDDSTREHVFNQVASALATPLREETDRLHIQVFQHEDDRWLLLESPEPIDLVKEVKINVFKQFKIQSENPSISSALQEQLKEIVRRARIPRMPANRFRPLDIQRRRLLERNPFNRSMTTPRRRTETANLYVLFEEGQIKLIDQSSGSIVTEELRYGIEISEELLSKEYSIDRWGRIRDLVQGAQYEWRSIGLLDIQNHDATAILLFPRSSAGFAAGRYRLDFRIERNWFDTDQLPGADNSYIDTVSREFNVH